MILFLCLTCMFLCMLIMHTDKELIKFHARHSLQKLYSPKVTIYKVAICMLATHIRMYLWTCRTSCFTANIWTDKLEFFYAAL